MTSAKQGKIITFYSYKGGTGRSMALANIAWILASNSKRVLVVDWDLEAPGLQRYFRPFLVDRELTSSPGVVDLITDFILAAITPLEKGEKLAPDWFVPKTDIDPYVISLDWTEFPTGGQLDFIPAGRQGPDYGQRFAAINWQKFYDVLGGGAFIEQLKINMRSQYDYILVDSRTGVSDTSGICTIQMPDTLVVCFTYNNQSIEGAASITQGVFDLRTAQDSNSLLARASQQASSASNPFYQSPYRFKVFPVPMRVDQSEKDKLGIRRSYAKRKFDPFLDRRTVVDRRSYWGAVAVPYVAYFSYEEILAPFKDDPADPATCLAAFTRIAREITEGDVSGYIPLIEPEDKEKILQEFASVPMPELVGGTGGGTGGTGPGAGVNVAVAGVGGIGSAAIAENQLESSLRRAEATLRSLNDEEREQARLLWMRLVRIPRPGENTENTKVRVPLSQVGRDSNPVIEKFAKAEVVTVSRDDAGASTVEVKDETLLRNWPTLDQWIKQDRDVMLWRQDLQSTVALWEERRKTWPYLLGGLRLWKAHQWYRTHRKYLSDKEAAYIEASRRLFITVNGLGLAIAAAVLLAFFFYQKSSNKSEMAYTIASNAESQIESARRGAQLSADQYQLGLLLATEAQQLAPTAKAEGLLKTELTSLPRRIGRVDIKSDVLDLALSPGGSQVLSVTGTPRLGLQAGPDSATAQLNDVSNGQVILRVSLKQGARRFHSSHDARYLAFYSSEGNTYGVDVIETSTGRTVITLNHGGEVNDISFSPDGNYLATAGDDKIARVVNLTAPGGVRSFDVTYTTAVRAVTFSGDSQHLAVLTDNSMVQVLRNIPSAVRFADYRGLTLPAVASVIALSHNGRYLATAFYEDRSVKLWDVETEQLLKKYEAAGVYYVTFTPDSKFLMGAATENMNVWNLSVDSQNTTIQYDGFDAVYLTIDVTYFATVKDTVARIWQFDGAAFKQTIYLVNNSNLLHLRFANPNFIVTADANNVVAVWKLGEPVTDNLRNEACSRLTRNMTIDEWNQHVASYLGGYRKTCSELP